MNLGAFLQTRHHLPIPAASGAAPHSQDTSEAHTSEAPGVGPGGQRSSAPNMGGIRHLLASLGGGGGESHNT